MMKFPSKQDIIVNKNGHYWNSRSLKVRNPEFYQYLVQRYEHVKWKKFTELLYLYVNNMDVPPVCPICGNPVSFVRFNVGYKRYCSNKCAQNSPEVKEIIRQGNIKKYGVPHSLQSKEVRDKGKQTCLKRYGVENASQSETIKEKTKQSNIDKYGVPYPLQLEEVKNKRKKTCLKMYGVDNVFASDKIKRKIKQTCLEKYGVENPQQTKAVRDKIKQTCLEKYGVDSVLKLPEFKQILIDKRDYIVEKIYQTKKRNHSFKNSSIERKFKDWLNEHNIEYKSQYKSDSYPFNCDFYFPKTNLYLEIQGHYTHGKHPFNPDDPEDIEKLEQLKQKNYHDTIDVWTRRDPLKRQWAKEHNLNWKEVFTIDLGELLEQTKGLF